MGNKKKERSINLPDLHPQQCKALKTEKTNNIYIYIRTIN